MVKTLLVFLTLGALLLGVGLGLLTTFTSVSDPAPTMTSTEVRELLTSVALGFSDLPPGYELAGAGVHPTNEEVAVRAVLGQPEMLAKFGEWGRITGYEVLYSKGSSVLAHGVSLYKNSAGAVAEFKWVPPGYPSVEEFLADEAADSLAGIFGFEPSDFTVDVHQLSFQSFGDLSVAYRISVSGQDEFELYTACVVTGRVLGCTMIIDSGSESDVILEELAALAEVMDRKMRSVQ